MNTIVIKIPLPTRSIYLLSSLQHSSLKVAHPSRVTTSAAIIQHSLKKMITSICINYDDYLNVIHWMAKLSSVALNLATHRDTEIRESPFLHSSPLSVHHPAAFYTVWHQKDAFPVQFFFFFFFKIVTANWVIFSWGEGRNTRLPHPLLKIISFWLIQYLAYVTSIPNSWNWWFFFKKNLNLNRRLVVF